MATRERGVTRHTWQLTGDDNDAVKETRLSKQKLQTAVLSQLLQARFPFKRNRLRCVRCVNEKIRKPIGMLGRSSGNHDWLLANASACVSCGFRLRNSRNARNASDCI